MRAILEAVGRVPRFEGLSRRPRGDHAIDHADLLVAAEEVGREVVLCDVAPGIEKLAVHDRELGTLRSDVAEPQPAVDVLPEIDDLAIGTGAGDGHGTELLHPARGRCGRIGQRPQVVVGHRDGQPLPVLDPVVLDLPRHEVRAQERPGGRHPFGPRADHGVASVELAEEAERTAEAVHALEEPRASSPPSVREDDLPCVVARHQQRADVVDLDVQGGGVTRVARRQLRITDTPAVEEGLVDPVRRGVEPGVGCRRIESEHVPQHVGGTGRLNGLDPARNPVGRVEQSGLEPGRRRPVALHPVGPDLDPPHDALPGRQRCGGPRDQDAISGLDPFQSSAVDLNGVGVLPNRAGRQAPRQARAALPQSERRGAEMLDREVHGRVHVARSMISFV